MIPFVKQYGYYRTGTNYTRALLEANCKAQVLVNQLGCKHSLPIDWFGWLMKPDKSVPIGLHDAVDSGDVRVLITVKDPYAWLDSFLPYLVRVKGVEATAGELAKRVRTYSANYAAWESWPAKLKYVTRYESLLANDADEVLTVASELELPLRPGGFHPITRRVDPHPKLRGNGKLDPLYWLDRRYLDNLTDVQKQIVTDNTDWPLMARLGGYQPL